MSDFAEADLPVLVLTDSVVFPGAVLHVHLDRLSDLQRQAVDRAADYAGKLFIVKSRQSAVAASAQSDLHSMGVIAEVKAWQSAGEHFRVAITAEARAELLKLQQIEGCLRARVRVIPHVAVIEGEGIELFQDATGPWEEYEVLSYDAGLYVSGISFSAPGLNLEDVAVLCDIFSHGAQVRIEPEGEAHYIDLQPLLEELDPFKRFRLFGEIFQAELDRLKNDPELQRKVEQERERRRQEQVKQQEQRAEKISKLKTIAAQGIPVETEREAVSWERLRLPMLPLRDAVVFPFTQLPFIAGREMSIAAVQQATQAGETIFLVAQRDPQIDAPAASDIFTTGVVARILRHYKLPDGNINLTVQGTRIAKIEELSKEQGYYSAVVEALVPQELSPELQQALEIAIELIGSPDISLEQRQRLLESWAGKSPLQWLAESVSIL